MINEVKIGSIGKEHGVNASSMPKPKIIKHHTKASVQLTLLTKPDLGQSPEQLLQLE